ncbi:MAG: RNA methyltransferase [Ruminococcaceae bacterium]|nr:RNA methyltransferase [Oscillospiraceae bacterium]
MNIKEIEGLQKRRNRQNLGCFFLEGYRAVTEAVLSGATIVQLVATETFVKTQEWQQIKKNYSSAYNKNAELVLLQVGDKSFAKLSETVTPQGVGAVIKMPQASLSDVVNDAVKAKKEGRFGLIILENMQDPGNMGTVIRTADASGFYGIICSKDTVDVYNSKVLRSTVGSMFRLPIVQSDFTGSEITEYLKSKGFNTVAAHPRGGESLFEADFNTKTAICIGNEAGGLSDEILKTCDTTVTIPMPGGAESLNASVAAALMMYEVRRKGEKT